MWKTELNRNISQTVKGERSELNKDIFLKGSLVYQFKTLLLYHFWEIVGCLPLGETCLAFLCTWMLFTSGVGINTKGGDCWHFGGIDYVFHWCLSLMSTLPVLVIYLIPVEWLVYDIDPKIISSMLQFVEFVWTSYSSVPDAYPIQLVWDLMIQNLSFVLLILWL